MTTSASATVQLIVHCK